MMKKIFENQREVLFQEQFVGKKWATETEFWLFIQHSDNPLVCQLVDEIESANQAVLDGEQSPVIYQKLNIHLDLADSTNFLK